MFYETFFPILIILFPLFIAGLIFVPPIRQYRKYPRIEYMKTNQRLLIKEGLQEDDVWFVKLDKIKKVIVRKGIIDKLFGTGNVYPITDEFTYDPSLYGFQVREDPCNPKKFLILQGANMKKLLNWNYTVRLKIIPIWVT